MLAFFAILEIPGEINYRMLASWSGASGGGILFAEEFSHGWPWYYLERDGGNTTVNTSKVPWLVPRAWKFWENASSSPTTVSSPNPSAFFPLFFFLDALVCLAILGVAIFLFEWRRRRHSHLFQFTLRELLLLVLVAAVVLSWWKVHHNQRVRELEIVEANEYFMDWSEEYRGPKILEKLLGTSWLDDFVVQTAYSCDFDAEKERVDRCIPYLPKCVGLEKISIQDCYDEQQGFVTDEVVAKLALLTRLQTLEIPCSKITDAAMEPISRFPKLTVLDISHTPVTNHGVRLLESLPLEKLNLCSTKIDDAAVESLVRMKDLLELDVSGTKLTDQAIPAFEKMTQLESLDITDTEISEQGYEELKAKLPDCGFSYKQ
jgi:hypothetical protein